MSKRRPSGEGMVRKREDGRWEGRIVVGHKKDGSYLFKSVFGKTQKQTLEKLHRMIELYRNVDLTEDSRMTVGEWLEKWINDYMVYTVRESTIEGLRSMLKHHILPAIGSRKLTSLTTADLQKFYNQQKESGRIFEHPIHGKKLSGSVVRQMHMVLHEALDQAVTDRLIVCNPTIGTVPPKRDTIEKQTLNQEQLSTFMEAIKNEPDWYDFFYTEIMTGLRRGEICALKWTDLDWETGKLHIARSVSSKGKIGETKTSTGTRTILLPKSVLALLKERSKKPIAFCEWIFPDFRDIGCCMRPNSAHCKLKVILDKAGLPNIRFHDLRHTFATHAIANGVDAKTLSGILGHTNASFTLDTYTHVTTDMQRSASVVIGKMVSSFLGKVGGNDETA